GLLLALSITKSLNSLLLGDHYAQTLGVSLQKSRFIILIATSILAGSLTAFVGPIAFVGLAVPHLIR
ncbi:MAG TPA: iron ABC transporter, partial [Leeuwenhoekiella sp.]|nr:iron ABC transporter [Leeuwenhoekiella sp.]